LDVTVKTDGQVDIRSELDVIVETGGQLDIRSELDVTVHLFQQSHPTHF
jgi:hypothetical protein